MGTPRDSADQIPGATRPAQHPWVHDERILQPARVYKWDTAADAASRASLCLSAAMHAREMRAEKPRTVSAPEQGGSLTQCYKVRLM